MGKWGWILALAAVGGAGYWLYKRNQNATPIIGVSTDVTTLMTQRAELQKQLATWQQYVNAGFTNPMYVSALTMTAQLNAQIAAIDAQIRKFI